MGVFGLQHLLISAISASVSVNLPTNYLSIMHLFRALAFAQRTFFPVQELQNN